MIGTSYWQRHGRPLRCNPRRFQRFFHLSGKIPPSRQTSRLPEHTLIYSEQRDDSGVHKALVDKSIENAGLPALPQPVHHRDLGHFP
jgi:hypothetical protein